MTRKQRNSHRPAATAGQPEPPEPTLCDTCGKPFVTCECPPDLPEGDTILDLWIALGNPKPDIYTGRSTINPDSPNRHKLGEIKEWPAIRDAAQQLFGREEFDGECWDRLVRWLTEKHGKQWHETSHRKPETDTLSTELGQVLDWLKEEQRGGAEQPKGKKTKGRSGRPADPDIDPSADKELCKHWKAAKAQGMTREAFTREHGINISDLIAAQHREKYRRNRDAE